MRSLPALIEETSSPDAISLVHYVCDVVYRELHDHIKFLCALNKHIYELYFSEAPRMKSVSNLECA